MFYVRDVLCVRGVSPGIAATSESVIYLGTPTTSELNGYSGIGARCKIKTPPSIVIS